MHRIRCHTLFDITQTGVLNRSKPNEPDMNSWLRRRNTQCNFDTILQVISLRSQPEVIRAPSSHELPETDSGYFGFLYEGQKIKYWRFDFEVQHTSVFENGIIPFGALYSDCEGVPMILHEEQTTLYSKFLNISPELRNIYFEIL